MGHFYAKEGGGGDNSGTSWDNPSPSIQTAIDLCVAVEPNTVWISGSFVLASQLDLSAANAGADSRLTLRGWDGTTEFGEGLPEINVNGLGGALTAAKANSTYYHLSFSNSTATLLLLTSQGLASECVFSGASVGYGASAGGQNNANIYGCMATNCQSGFFGANSGAVVNCTVVNPTTYGVVCSSGGVAFGNTVISGGGAGIYSPSSPVVLLNNRLVGDGVTANAYGIRLLSVRGSIVMLNHITGWSATGNVGLRNETPSAIGIAGANFYQNNATDEQNIANYADVYLSAAGAGPGIVVAGAGSGGTAPTAAENATAVHAKLLADEAGTAGSLAERLSVGIPNQSPGTLGGLLTSDANNRAAGITGTVNTLDEIAGPGFSSAFALDQQATLAEQYAEIKKLFDTETWAELTGVPNATPTTADVLMWLYMMARNALSDDRLTGQQTVSNDAGSSIGTASRSDDGDTFTRDKFTAS